MQNQELREPHLAEHKTPQKQKKITSVENGTGEIWKSMFSLRTSQFYRCFCSNSCVGLLLTAVSLRKDELCPVLSAQAQGWDPSCPAACPVFPGADSLKRAGAPCYLQV